jgi:hypothetical protein
MPPNARAAESRAQAPRNDLRNLSNRLNLMLIIDGIRLPVNLLGQGINIYFLDINGFIRFLFHGILLWVNKVGLNR